MNSLVFSLLAAICAAFSCLFFRKNSDLANTNRSKNGYLVLFYSISFLLSVFLFPSLWSSPISYTMLGIGASVGLISSIIMLLTINALKRGPAGLTFAFQNASAVFPGLLLFLFLGSDFGFTTSSLQIVGMTLVLLGLYVGSMKKTTQQSSPSITWLKYAVVCFILQILALTCIQARCILFDYSHIGGFNFSVTKADDIWFMPGQFGAACLLQIGMFWKEAKGFERKEILLGCAGGLANFASTVLLLIATKFAMPIEKTILFPCFAVFSMILCNIWANRIYKEEFNFKTNALCSFGIFTAVLS